MSSRYFATVRRVTLMPIVCNMAVICSSVRGLARSSSPIIFFTMRLSSSSGVAPPTPFVACDGPTAVGADRQFGKCERGAVIQKIDSHRQP